MWKKIAVFSFSILFFAACAKTEQPAANANPTAQKNADAPIVISGHLPQQEAVSRPQNSDAQNGRSAKPEMRAKWSQSGSPIDTSEFDAEIARAEKSSKAKPKDEQAKRFLAEAYLKRAVVLTDARQYASALGDYRRVLKYDASNEDAKTWVKQIIEIYDGLNKQAPNEGEEPPPLPFEKKT